MFKNPTYLHPKYDKIFMDDETFEKTDVFYENSFKMPVWYNNEDVALS